MITRERSYLLYGPPASGKSTVAKETSELINSSYLSVGEMTRFEIASQSERGMKLKKCLDDVVEYPIELISNLVEEKIVEAISFGKGFILDGFPKYPWEAKSFIELMSKHDFVIDTVILVDIPFEEAILRVSNRRMCDDCLTQFTISSDTEHFCMKCGGNLHIREDDQPEVLRRRYSDYEMSIVETLNALEGHYSRLVKIDGTKEKDFVIEEFARVAQQ